MLLANHIGDPEVIGEAFSVLGGCATELSAQPGKQPSQFRAGFATEFNSAYNTKHPFICAGMAFVCDTPDLAIAVSEAGGVGCIAASLLSPQSLSNRIEQIQQATSNPFHVNFLTIFPYQEQLNVCIDRKVPIASFHWGTPPPGTIERLQAAGTKVWTSVGSVAAAKEARAAGVDAICVQGYEAGGHNYAGLPLQSLFTEVKNAVPDRPLFAAGGISDGVTAAAAFAAGADAVWVGTRMVATNEANAHTEYKRRIVAASGEDTIITHVFGPEVPAFNPMRVIKNATVEVWQNRVNELPADRSTLPTIGRTLFAEQMKDVKPYDSFVVVPETSGDFEQMPMLAGQGSGLITSIEPAGDVVAAIMAEVANTLSRFA